MRLTQTGEAVDLDIILVHGTWGRGIFPSSRPSPKSVAKPRWFQPHSRLRASLEKALSDAPESLTYSVSTFERSGANSFIERSEAAQSLAARLDAESSSHPHKKHILIGHSHGGSVCMLACVHVKTARPNIVTFCHPFHRARRQRNQ